MALRHVRIDVPNLAQRIPLRLTDPSLDNCRLFVERESLAKLRKRYHDYKNGITTILPDPPILRRVAGADLTHRCDECNGEGVDICVNNERASRFEILAGERRITAATMEGIDALPCRVVVMSDEEAYRFMLEHNAVGGITTVELAFRAAEMARLGFDNDTISDAIGGASVSRYTTVGALVNPDWFTDHAKQCDPSIVEWYEAASFGEEHFAKCFRNWNLGKWDEKACSKNFRRRGEVLPIDNTEKGIRVTYDLNRFVLRGQIDLDIIDADDAHLIIEEVMYHLRSAQRRLDTDEHFGLREVHRINPQTI